MLISAKWWEEEVRKIFQNGDTCRKYSALRRRIFICGAPKNTPSKNSLHDPDRSNTKSINGMFIISITHCIVHYCLLLTSTPLNSIQSSHTLLYPRMVATQMEKEVSNEMKQIGLNLSKEMLSKCKFPFFWSILELN
jgi:hypothetical protein